MRLSHFVLRPQVGLLYQRPMAEDWGRWVGRQ